MILTSAVVDLNVTHIVTSKIEHHAVLHTVEALQHTHGIRVSYVNLDEFGSPDMEDLKSILQATTDKTLVSLMHVNNEIGNMIDIDAFAAVCKEYQAYFHSDTVQSIGHWEWDLAKIPVDFLTAAAHKFHGPKGVGFAFISKNIPLKPMIHGGEQERGFRAGSVSFYNIIGLEEAFVLVYENIEQERNYVGELKAYFIERLKGNIPGVKFNGHSGDDSKSTYTLVNVCLPLSADKGTLLLFQLDLKGISCSKGSACQSGSDTGSHVLNAILKQEDLNKPSVRFSFSKFNTKEELDYVVNCLKEYVTS